MNTRKISKTKCIENSAVICSFDSPHIMKKAIAILKNKGIGRFNITLVEPQQDGSIKIYLEYFNALDKLPTISSHRFREQNSEVEYQTQIFREDNLQFVFYKPNRRFNYEKTSLLARSHNSDHLYPNLL